MIYSLKVSIYTKQMFDDIDMFENQKYNFVQVDDMMGLSMVDLYKASTILKQPLLLKQD